MSCETGAASVTAAACGFVPLETALTTDATVQVDATRSSARAPARE
jgi:hypothetical protein